VGAEFRADATSKIAGSAILQDGTSVGEQCTIHENSLIRGSIICAGVEIGAGSEIRNSFIAPGSLVPKDSKIIGNYYSNELISPLNL
jgi:NDP-sugar pyrophosphorylase family protein